MPRLFALSFIWGWSFLFIKVAGEDLTPTAVAGGRTFLGAVVLLAVLRAQGVSFPRDRRTLGHFLVVGAFGSAIPFTLLAWGGQHIDSGLSAVLNASTPLFTAGLAVPILGERIRPRVLLGLVVGFVGVGIVAGVGGSDLTGVNGLAALAPVVAGACYGLTFCWAARHLMGVPTVVAAAGQVTAATVLLAPAAVVTSIVHGVVPGPRQIGSLLLLGALGTGLAYVLSFRIVADLGATAASLCTYLIPVVALGVGAVVLDEQISLRTVIGGAITIAAVAIVTGARRHPGPGAAEPGADPALPLAPDVGAPPPRPPSPSRNRGALTTLRGPERAPVRRRWGRGAVAAGVVAGLAIAALGACGGGGGDGGACGAVRREPLDRRAVHVLPGADDVDYQTDPPTSGPHLASPSTESVRDDPIEPALQVGLLEEGTVLVQHHGVTAAERADLEELAGEGVVVAPAASLPDGAAVVLTAWVTKQVCSEVDVAAARAFATEQRDRGPGDHE